MRFAATTALLIATGATAALAQDAGGQDKNLCSERPGLTTNECVIDKGHVQIETGLADWTLDRRSGEREDTILFGDSLLRVGVGDGLELRLGWTPFGYDRDRDEDGVTHAHRVGDITIGAKRNLVDAQTHGDVGLSIAALPFATLPVGRRPIGAGTWGAGAELPLGYRFDKSFKVELTPIVEAAPDEDGHGRHLRYSAAVGAKYNLSDAVAIEVDEQVERNRDPDSEERATMVLTGFSIAAQPNKRLQLDLGTNVGMNHRTPDAEVYAGFTKLF